jgi:hypothetical protein
MVAEPYGTPGEIEARNGVLDGFVGNTETIQNALPVSAEMGPIYRLRVAL